MPIYEYRCISCGHVFTLLRSYAKRDEQALCPECKSDQWRRLISNVAVTSSESSGGTSGGSCGTSRFS